MKRAVIIGICLCYAFVFVLFFASTVYADFGLMLGSFKIRSNAQDYLERFIKQQESGDTNSFLQEIVMPGKGTWYRVCVGPFVSRDAAIQKQRFFMTRGQDSVIVSMKPSARIEPMLQSSESVMNPNLAHQRYVKEISVPKTPSLVPAKASIPQSGNSQSGGMDKTDVYLTQSPDEPKPQVKAPDRETISRQAKDTDLSGSDGEGVIISAGDVLSITIPTQKQMSQKYDVDPEGRIFLLSVGEVQIGGLELSMVEKKIAVLLRQLIPKGEKPITKLSESLRYIQITGGVNYPGWYRVPQKSNLDELVEMAGGLSSGVDFSEIKLRRATASGSKEIRVHARVSLEPNDVLIVPTSRKFERKIDSGDLLFINIPDKPAETGLSEIERRVTQNQIEVDKSGYIYIPNYGHIFVKNLTTTEVGKLIASRLPKYLSRSANVHVNIIEKKHYVQISGHVARPGWYNIPETDNVQAALTAAGGAVDGAIMSRVTVTRKWGGQIRKVRINLYQFTVTGDVRLLTPVQENDSIFVPISGVFGDVKRTLGVWTPPSSKLEEDTGRKVRIFGAVFKPGIYEPKEDMNILDLILLAGGNTAAADLAKTLLIRENKTLTYDLNSLIIQNTQGSAKIPGVQNGDSVYIGYMKMAGQEITEPKKMVRIFGGVKKPGVFEPVPDMTLMDIFSLAKGGTYDADLTKVMIMHRDGNMERFDLQEYLDAKDPDPSNLPKINASDTVYVAYLQHLDLEKKEPIYLLGKVSSPGQYDLAEGGMTVFQMLAYAGGLDEWADTENIRIIRMVNGRQRNIPYNLRKALSGKYPELNIRLRSFDTIYVP